MMLTRPESKRVCVSVVLSNHPLPGTVFTLGCHGLDEGLSCRAGGATLMRMMPRDGGAAAKGRPGRAHAPAIPRAVTSCGSDEPARPGTGSAAQQPPSTWELSQLLVVSGRTEM